jgi:cytochrome c-type protein NapC
MNPENQKKRSRKQHILGMEQGNTCIDCHKGIAHKKVHDQLSDEELEAMEEPYPEHKHPIPPQWQAVIDGVSGDSKLAAAAEEEAESEAAAEPAATEEPEPVTEVAQASTEAPAASSAPAAGGSVDWTPIEAYPVTLFYTGQASMEWVLKGSDHGGKRAFVTGDRCFDCHEDEEVDIGDLVVTGEKAEDSPIPDKRGSILVNIKAAYDADNLYMQFQWEDGEHAPIPFVDGGKMDPENPIKLAIMLTTDDEDNPQVEYAERSGCWQTCHHDLNYMPHQPGDDALSGPLASRLDLSGGFTKYLKESRSEIEIDGKDGKMRGGWDKLKEQAEIDAAFAGGAFMDLLRYKAGTGESEDGHILEQRVMTGGQGVSFSGGLADGVWTIEMVRKLTSDKPGDVSMSKDNWYNIGFAIHDDYSSSRFHHVSLGFKLGFDDEDAEINAIGQ